MKELLKQRFVEHSMYHEGTSWDEVESLLSKKVLAAVSFMEETLGEPEVIAYKDELYIVDMSNETPKGRVALCYDEDALAKRKKNPPKSSVEKVCDEHHLHLVDEEMYFALQSFKPLDQKTTSWLKTNEDVRNLGGAIFGDHRYGRTFIYHNGADSYYSSRGFRAYIKL